MNWRPSSQPTASKASPRTRDFGHDASSPPAPRVAQVEADPARLADQEPLTHYGRTQFLRDAAWMGLVAQNAFSRSDLRRRRDYLMSIHHPDRGGSEHMAVHINEIYSRMMDWLDRRRQRRERLRKRQEYVPDQPAGEGSKLSPFLAAFQNRAIRLSALALMAAVGYSSLFRRRR
jgi:hypothetical protein